MAEDINITTREELEAWLEDRPKEWEQIIALRSALRVFPTTVMVAVVEKNYTEQLT